MGGLFNYNIKMIMKGEGVTNSDPKYVQFVHTFDTGISLGQINCIFLRG